MSETKFTPGPWMDASFDDETNDSQIFSQETYQAPGDPTEKRVHIATVYDNDANAHLIASAPEILSALESLLKHAETLLEASRAIDGLVDSRLNLESDIEEAQAAIAKAKGQP